MNILIACEESQAVVKEMRAKGHNAFSCDILDCSGGHPEWHIKDDVVPLLGGSCTFTTVDGIEHSIEGRWDMIIGFPPCTHLAVSGARHFAAKRADGRQREGLEFFCKILRADCDKIVVENPVNIVGGGYVKEYFPDICAEYGLPQKVTQYVEPYMFGDPHKKKTGLWIKGLPKLEATDVVEPELVYYKSKKTKSGYSAYDAKFGTMGKGHGKDRSKTFPGIAKAMADQWG